MVPLAGSGATLSKAALKYGDEAVALVKQADEVVPAVSKSADEAVGTLKRSPVSS